MGKLFKNLAILVNPYKIPSFIIRGGGVLVYSASLIN